ncbi:5-oxoprolinase subunit PxpA [Paenarthrobacter sp. DKR-5]|uniref:5-oxoprolinase subunit PxpA n=1 Tax=Paenarthrobacter sp. DKR-5 TaxID=2835535 RepID=UPI001BDBE43A|nr:5-oxoprolinase subunit PxpA [Paenarthrobacter sp. DKR-5]MBT1001564.1 5-oxoprolinase subunit PxpA [Paenarthrobacter sp. DKR-5]
MGEAFGLHTFGNDLNLMTYVDVANVACGFHSGDPEAMAETVREAAARGVKIGAHPGLPDLVGFGRREMKLTAQEVENLLTYQVGALTGFLRAAEVPLNHIKPHGSLYGMLARDPELMTAAAAVAARFEVPFYGLAGTEHQKVCESQGVPFVGELYVDLNYGPGGELLIQRRPEPTDPQAAAERVRRVLQEGVVEAVDGTLLTIAFESICVHSDAPNSVQVAAAVRDVLDGAPRAAS